MAPGEGGISYGLVGRADRGGGTKGSVAMRSRRTWVRAGLVLAGVAVLATLALLWSPDPAVAGKRALAAAKAAVAAAPAPVLSTGPLRAGWARRCITPDHPVGLFGFGGRRGALSTGVADDLFVKALCLDNGSTRLLVFTADLLLMPDSFTGRVRREFCRPGALQESAVLFSATHTHGAPSPWDVWVTGLLAGGGYDHPYGAALHAAFVDAAREAMGQLAPVTAASSTVSTSAWIANRVRPDNPVDATVRFLLFEGEGGQRCVLANVPAHGTVLSGRNRLVTGDWAGWLQRQLESRPGVFAMVQAGAVGSIRPVPPEPTAADLEAVLAEARKHGLAGSTSLPATAPAEWRDFARACALGRVVARQIEDGAAGLVPARQAVLAHGSLAWSLPPARIYLLSSRPLPPWLAGALGIDSATAFQALRIGGVVLEGIGGELSGELLLPLAAAARVRGVELWVSSFSRDYKGYISPDQHYLGGPGGQGAYETRDMAWFGPRAGACFSEIISGQVAQFAAGPAAAAAP